MTGGFVIKKNCWQDEESYNKKILNKKINWPKMQIRRFALTGQPVRLGVYWRDMTSFTYVTFVSGVYNDLPGVCIQKFVMIKKRL